MGSSTRALKPSGFSASAMKPLSLSAVAAAARFSASSSYERSCRKRSDARPLFRDHRKFSKMADPLLQGHYPTRGLYQALVIAAMCLQEQAATRPLIGDVVAALTYLASQVHDPNAAAASRFNRVGPSSPRAREDRKSLGVGLDRQHALRSLFGYSPDLRHTGLFRAPNPGYGRRGDVGGGSGVNLALDELHIQESGTDSPVHPGKARELARRISNQALDRERAVAEAKVWGENWMTKYIIPQAPYKAKFKKSFNFKNSSSIQLLISTSTMKLS